MAPEAFQIPRAIPIPAPDFRGAFERFPRQVTMADVEKEFLTPPVPGIEFSRYFIQKKDGTRIGIVIHFNAGGCPFRTEIGYILKRRLAARAMPLRQRRSSSTTSSSPETSSVFKHILLRRIFRPRRFSKGWVSRKKENYDTPTGYVDDGSTCVLGAFYVPNGQTRDSESMKNWELMLDPIFFEHQ